MENDPKSTRDLELRPCPLCGSPGSLTTSGVACTGTKAPDGCILEPDFQDECNRFVPYDRWQHGREVPQLPEEHRAKALAYAAAAAQAGDGWVQVYQMNREAFDREARVVYAQLRRTGFDIVKASPELRRP